MALVHRLSDIKSTTGYDEEGREYLVIKEVREFDTFNGVDHKTRFAVNGKMCKVRDVRGGEITLFCEALGKKITCRF